MKKIFVSVISLYLVLALLPCTAFSAEYPDTSWEEDGVQVKAYVVTPEGEKLPVDFDCEVGTISSASQYYSGSGVDDSDVDETGMTYFATVKYETDDSGYTKNGIDASGQITMAWVDNFGSDNTIKSLSGRCDVVKGTFESGRLYWNSSSEYMMDTPSNQQRTVNRVFDESINYKSTDSFAGNLWACVNFEIKSPSDGKTYYLYVEVSPTIFS